jgi:hypothetical protein
MRTTQPSLLILAHLINIIFGEEYKLFSYLLCIYLQPPYFHTLNILTTVLSSSVYVLLSKREISPTPLEKNAQNYNSLYFNLILYVREGRPAIPIRIVEHLPNLLYSCLLLEFSFDILVSFPNTRDFSQFSNIY